MRPGRTYFPLLRTLTGTHLSTDSLSLSPSFKTSPSSVIQPLQIFPTHPASHFYPFVDPPRGGSDQMSPSVRSSTSVCQRHHRPPVAPRMLKRFLSGVIKMSHFCVTKSLSREQFVRAVTFSLLSKNFHTFTLISLLSKMLRPGEQPPHLPQAFKQNVLKSAEGDGLTHFFKAA